MAYLNTGPDPDPTPPPDGPSMPGGLGTSNTMLDALSYFYNISGAKQGDEGFYDNPDDWSFFVEQKDRSYATQKLLQGRPESEQSSFYRARGNPLQDELFNSLVRGRESPLREPYKLGQFDPSYGTAYSKLAGGGGDLNFSDPNDHSFAGWQDPEVYGKERMELFGPDYENLNPNAPVHGGGISWLPDDAPPGMGSEDFTFRPVPLGGGLHRGPTLTQAMEGMFDDFAWGLLPGFGIGGPGSTYPPEGPT